jgi:acyl-CoA thioesterase-1
MVLVWLWLGAGAAQAAAPEPVVLVMGDSLSAAYGIPATQGWVARLQQRLGQQGYPHRVVNASVSGETSAGGLARLPTLLQRHRPALVLIELGANDGLRGLPVAQVSANLARMLALVRQAKARALLFEMRMPPNYGPAYAERFQRAYAELAQAERVPLVPFFLATIALDPAQFLDDGLHPSALAQPRLLEAVWPTLQPLLGAPARGALHPESTPLRKPGQELSHQRLS